MDAVITYVNGLDPVWLEQYRSFAEKTSMSSVSGTGALSSICFGALKRTFLSSGTCISSYQGRAKCLTGPTARP